MRFSAYPYITVVLFILVVNVWLAVRFLLKARKWGDDSKNDDV
ncbi:MAG: hypothetical protein ACE5EN_01995 [Nitrospinota bacterium]